MQVLPAGAALTESAAPATAFFVQLLWSYFPASIVVFLATQGSGHGVFGNGVNQDRCR